MGADWSYQDFTACSPHPVAAGSRVSYIYQPTSALNNNITTNGNGAPSSSTPLPERVKSAPTAGRYDIMAATPTSSPKDDTAMNNRGCRTESTAAAAAAAAAVAVGQRTSSSSSSSATAAAAADSQFQQNSTHNGSNYNRPAVNNIKAAPVRQQSDTASAAAAASTPAAEVSMRVRSTSLPKRLDVEETLTSSSTECDCSCHGSCDIVRSLQVEMHSLKSELSRSHDTIASLRQNEAVLRQRLSEQAQRQIEKGSTRFEDLSLGNMRPTQLVRRYGNLYSEGRLDALDALDDIPELANFDELKGKLLLTIVVLSFRNAQKNLTGIKTQVRYLLNIPSAVSIDSANYRLKNPHQQQQHQQPHQLVATSDAEATYNMNEAMTKELDDVIAVYLRRTVDRFDLLRNYKEVCDRVWDTLYDFPSLRHCTGLLRYIDECVRLAWALTVQVEPFTIHYEQSRFQADLHTRFHTSDPNSDTIKAILWPALTEGTSGPCVFKGVVIT